MTRRWGSALTLGGSLAACVAAWWHYSTVSPPQQYAHPLPLLAPAPVAVTTSISDEPTPEPAPRFGVVEVNAITAVQPVGYAWTIRPAPLPPWLTFRFDTCSIALRSTTATSARVVLYYRTPAGATVGVHGQYTDIPFPAGQTVTVERDVPWDRACPCLVCVTQLCPGGWPHTQCATVLRPGDALPAGWTPFSQLGALAPCQVSTPPVAIFSDGFEGGTLKSWRTNR